MKVWLSANQASLFDNPIPPRFDGPGVTPVDVERLTGQAVRVWNVMKDGKWRTLADIRAVIGITLNICDSEAGISARLRDFRKARFGGHKVERRRISEPMRGTFEYRLEVKK